MMLFKKVSDITHQSNYFYCQCLHAILIYCIYYVSLICHVLRRIYLFQLCQVAVSTGMKVVFDLILIYLILVHRPCVEHTAWSVPCQTQQSPTPHFAIALNALQTFVEFVFNVFMKCCNAQCTCLFCRPNRCR